MKQQNNGAANVAPISGNVGLIGDKHSFKEKLTEFSKTYEGKTVEILCEDYDKKRDLYLGRDEYGRMGYFKSDKNEIGNFVKIKVGKTNGISLYGDMVQE